MDKNENNAVECILRIENPAINFNRDLKVSLPEESLDDDTWTFEDIYNGASQTLLQKYLPQLKEVDVKVSLLRPLEIDVDDFREFLEDADTNKAKADINAILASLPEDKRAKVLATFTK